MPQAPDPGLSRYGQRRRNISYKQANEKEKKKALRNTAVDKGTAAWTLEWMWEPAGCETKRRSYGQWDSVLGPNGEHIANSQPPTARKGTITQYGIY